ncbi:hydrolase [Desulfosporosinus shakirovi]|uniref:hydrolase n=1 Tax=Desulfosporosinus shakirovi TaxID=2885154 RepID=UPI001E34434D|nr:hydrolase [Desulfosporosinus sp. SRJS8]MCB8815300.1 hydrolase [Desulfosporosinus sp. SRJS8]
MTTSISRDEALELLMKYNKDPFHILHGLTVSGVMMWFADTLGYAGESEYWGIVGLLHDIDYEMYPDQHCIKAEELLRSANVSAEMIYSISSHGYGICVDIKPIHLMEKILYATDELTGLINAAVKMRPSKSSLDLELSSLKKKFKDKKFAAGCSRNVIQRGAAMLDWNLDELLEKTILAMRSCEESVNQTMKNLELT